MSKLNSKNAVIEWYWPDFLEFCMSSFDSYNHFQDTRPSKSDYGIVKRVNPTVDNFWLWYITVGPMEGWMPMGTTRKKT